MAETTNHYIDPWKLFYGAFVPNWLLQRRGGEVSPGAKLVYGRLGAFAGKRGRGVVSGWTQATIAAAVGMSPRQLQLHVDALRELGLITVEPGRSPGAPNVYRFLYHPWMGADLAPTAPHRTGAQSVAPTHAQSVAPRRAQSVARRSVNDCAPDAQSAAHPHYKEGLDEGIDKLDPARGERRAGRARVEARRQNRAAVAASGGAGVQGPFVPGQNLMRMRQSVEALPEGERARVRAAVLAKVGDFMRARIGDRDHVASTDLLVLMFEEIEGRGIAGDDDGDAHEPDRADAAGADHEGKE